MIAEYRINLKNKTKEELIMLLNEALETIQKQEKEIKRLKETKIYTKEEMYRIEKEDMGYDR